MTRESSTPPPPRCRSHCSSGSRATPSRSTPTGTMTTRGGGPSSPPPRTRRPSSLDTGPEGQLEGHDQDQQHGVEDHAPAAELQPGQGGAGQQAEDQGPEQYPAGEGRLVEVANSPDGHLRVPVAPGGFSVASR